MLTCTKFLALRVRRLAILSASTAAVLLGSSTNGQWAVASPTATNTANTNTASASSVKSYPVNTKTSTKPTVPVTLDGKNSFRLLQHSQTSGEDEILVCPFGIKITNLRHQQVTLLPKPFTEIYCYKAKTKKIFHGPIKEYKSPFASSMALLKSVTFNDIKTTKFKEGTYKGCSAAYSNISKEVMAQRQKEKSNGDLVGRAPRLFEMVTSSKLNIPPVASRFLHTYYGLPEKPGLPLQMNYTTFSGQTHHYLTTDKIEAKLCKPSDMATPSGFSKVKQPSDLLIDEDSEDSMKMIIMDH